MLTKSIQARENGEKRTLANAGSMSADIGRRKPLRQSKRQVRNNGKEAVLFIKA